MSILDDAREGMNPDIRPQDDLFGHVNGRWLDEAEIPSDRSSWGPFVQLADAAEEQVRAIIEDLAADASPRATAPHRRGRPQDRRPLRLLHGRAEAIDALGHRARCGRCSTRWRPARRPRPGGVPRRVRADRRRRPVRVLRRHRRPQVRPLPLQPRPGRPRPARRVLLPRRQVRRDPREVRRLPRRGCSRWPATTTPPAAAATVLAIETRLAAGHWERAETRDVQKTYNLHDRRRAQGALPGLRLGRLRQQPRRQRRRPLAEACVRQPSYLAHLSTVLDEVPIEDWRAWLLGPRAALRGAVPHRRLRRDQLRLLRPHPQRHARAARPLEARRRAGRGRDRRGGRQGVRRPALPAALQGA